MRPTVRKEAEATSLGPKEAPVGPPVGPTTIFVPSLQCAKRALIHRIELNCCPISVGQFSIGTPGQNSFGANREG